jgi:NADPH-dependent curcumin reductase CurA
VSEYGDGLDWEKVNDVRVYRQLMGTSASVRGFLLFHFVEQIPKHFQKLMALLEQGKLRAEIDPKPFHGVQSIKEASLYLRSGKNRGKVLVRF